MRPFPTARLRPANATDEAFLFQLYAGTRAEELAATGWPRRQQDAFLHDQYALRKEDYRTRFPNAQHLIVELNARPAGAVIVHRTANEIRLVDIALRSDCRGLGVGSNLIRDFQDEARTSGRALRLHVLKNSRAAQLYLRLGFAPAGENGAHLKMEWTGR